MLNQIANADHPLEALVEFALQQKGASVTLDSQQTTASTLVASALTVLLAVFGVTNLHEQSERYEQE
jgi:hypothetical protein